MAQNNIPLSLDSGNPESFNHASFLEEAQYYAKFLKQRLIELNEDLAGAIRREAAGDCTVLLAEIEEQRRGLVYWAGIAEEMESTNG